uniref:C3H1-type domain-containing protein n=1 Tax=Meloidogyne incognita TaxID=6306 RepID=A0A914M4H6_MELIC
MNVTNHIQRRPLSLSSFQPNYEAHQPVELTQYINPESEAHHVLLAHHQRQWRNSRRYIESYKTVMCQNWLERAQCSFGKNCRFAHGFDDLRTPTLPLPINEKYKTRLCEKYTSRGICPYGSRCLFIHPDNVQNNLQPNYIQSNYLNTTNYFARSMQQQPRASSDAMQLEMERFVNRLIDSPLCF